ncbi:MAG TPA: PilZ domain-containing protein [Thermoanaerobaculia bacterium]|nr:PilZ domain-containing protein [Thermoanaerobaculia bacterium]
MPKLAQARANPASERRKAPRYRPGVILSATLGWHDAIVGDLSVTGARIHHFSAIKRGEVMRFTMHHDQLVFSTLARVLSSTVEALGSGPSGAATYESRVQFVDIGHAEKEILVSLVNDLQERQARRWVRNAKGDYEPEPPSRLPAYYVRLQLTNGGWRETATRDAKQPEEGMTIPADTTPSERRMICDVYKRADRAGRMLIRLIAAAVSESIARGPS